jgi:serine O-acetyltransferase
MYVLGLHSILSPIYLGLGGQQGKASKVVAWIYHLATIPMGCEVPLSARLGRGLSMPHTTGIVIAWRAQVGDGCTITPGVVIGGNSRGGVPRVGDNVYIGANAVIIGDISIGNHSTIGAGAVVVEDVPESALVVGNPGKIVKLPYHRPYHNQANQDEVRGGT